MGERRTASILLLILCFAIVSISEIGIVKAEPKTIVVPDDYPTITVAIRNAVDGDRIFVKKGTYEEKTLEIDKRLSLIGEGAEFTKINLDPPLYVSPPDAINRSSSWFGHSITVDANDFKLSGFTINTPIGVHTPGGAISITGNRTQIIGNSITGDVHVYGSHSNITGNKFSGTIRAFGSYLNISANSRTESDKVGTTDIGINLDGSFCIIYGNNLTVDGLSPAIWISGDGNTVARNFVDRAMIGMRIVGSNNIICANRITNSGSSGFFPSSTAHSDVGLVASGNNTIYANYVANNQWGANINEFLGTNVASLYHNNFINNAHQVAAVDRFVYGIDNFDNGEEGNYWSDYTGKDDNGDGIGDTPYVIDANRTDRYPLMAPFDISTVPIEMPEWASPAPSPTGTEEPTETHNPTEAEQPTKAPLITTETTIIATLVAAIVITAAIILLFKKRNR